MKSRILVAAVALTAVLASHECLLNAAGDAPKLTVRVAPLVHLTRGDTRGVVVVPRHADNRLLRVILESEDYYSRSDIQLDGQDAPQDYPLYWRDLPPGSYSVTIRVYGTAGLRGSTSIGFQPISSER
jgi:hypothetical protein